MWRLTTKLYYRKLDISGVIRALMFGECVEKGVKGDLGAETKIERQLFNRD